MAKAQENRNSPTKGKLTVLMIQVEGSDQTLQESLKTLEGAFEKLAPRNVITKSYASVGEDRTQIQSAAASSIETSESTDEILEEGSDETLSEARRTKRKKTYAIPSVVGDLNLEEGSPTFSDFFTQKGSPKAILDRYLVSAAWLREVKNITAVGPDHMFTIFKTMEWVLPKNWLQPFNDAKKLHSWFDKGEQPGDWKINNIGLSAATKMGRPSST